MKCTYSCQTAEHVLARRTFLGGLVGVGATAGMGGLVSSTAAKELAQQDKHVLVVFLSGGSSQLETWDPKPGTDTGGPFRAIPTSVPGVHISELLPLTAKQMHRMVLVRGVNTKENDHGKGRFMMEHGRKQIPGLEYPHLGAVTAKLLENTQNPLPGFIRIGGRGRVNKDAAYLGPRYASVAIANGGAPENTQRPGGISAASDAARNDLRRKVNDRFARQRRTAETEAYTHSYEQALHLMKRREVFDIAKEPEREKERYGKHEFGQHCLLARRMIENGVSFVQVTHSNYDTHNENFDFHLEQLGEFDGSFAYLLEDLAQRGLLQNTLVIVMSEFGRTPQINHYYGRDHWGTAWSVALAGSGLKPGAVIGKTNANGTQVIDREVDHGHLFHTYLRAIGVKSTRDFTINGRAVPMADPARTPIEEILA
jgi:hypothetical protein